MLHLRCSFSIPRSNHLKHHTSSILKCSKWCLYKINITSNTMKDHTNLIIYLANNISTVISTDMRPGMSWRLTISLQYYAAAWEESEDVYHLIYIITGPCVRVTGQHYSCLVVNFICLHQCKLHTIKGR